MRVVIDANVFVSALNFGGTPEQILGLHSSEAFEIYISTEIIEELWEVLLDSFAWPPRTIEVSVPL